MTTPIPITTEESLNQINTAPWILDEFNTLNLYIDFPTTLLPPTPPTLVGKRVRIHCFLTRRPYYCDRGHICLSIVAPLLYLNSADSFPRYFWTFHEADTHTRTFLRWRLHK